MVSGFVPQVILCGHMTMKVAAIGVVTQTVAHVAAGGNVVAPSLFQSHVLPSSDHCDAVGLLLTIAAHACSHIPSKL